MRNYARRRRDSGGEDNEERLRQLLDTEQRLEALVRAATEDAARRVEIARAARDGRVAAARQAAVAADAERARAEQIAHEQARAAIDAAADAAIAAITLSDARVDALARWALGEAIRGTGDPP